MTKQRFHLIPAEREKECMHPHWSWSGTISCTGFRRCNMCGDDIDVAPAIGVAGAGAYSTHAREDTGERGGPEATT